MPNRNRYFIYCSSAYYLLFLLFLVQSTTLSAQTRDEDGLDLGQEYSDYNKVKSSGNAGGPLNGTKDRGVFLSTLLFIPNRIFDFIDIFRFDVGIGPAVGAVVRITPNGQAGARFMMPLSVRAGLRGRRMPIFIEHSNEMGIGPLFLDSSEREITPVEVGIGADLILAGAYVGVSIDSIFDFFGGFVGWDISEDDF